MIAGSCRPLRVEPYLPRPFLGLGSAEYSGRFTGNRDLISSATVPGTEREGANTALRGDVNTNEMEQSPHFAQPFSLEFDMAEPWKKRQIIHSEFRERLLEAQEKERDELLRRHGKMREDKLRELNAFRGFNDDGDSEDSSDLRSD